MNIVAWRAWYTKERGKDRIFESGADLVQSFIDLPADGFLAMRTYSDVMALPGMPYGEFVSSLPEYARDPKALDYVFIADTPSGLVIRCDPGPPDKLMAEFGIPADQIKKGTLVSDAEFERVNDLMTAATVF